MQRTNTVIDKIKFVVFMSPTKFIITAPMIIGSCAIIAQRVSKPKMINLRY